MNVTGKLEKILDVESGVSKAGKDWQKQSIVINNGSEYNPLVCIGFFGDDKLEMLKAFKEGDNIEVSINLSSREFKDKWYTQVDGWKIEKVEAKVDSAPAENDDLPF
jgi:hypothetical protein